MARSRNQDAADEAKVNVSSDPVASQGSVPGGLPANQPLPTRIPADELDDPNAVVYRQEEVKDSVAKAAEHLDVGSDEG